MKRRGGFDFACPTVAACSLGAACAPGAGSARGGARARRGAWTLVAACALLASAASLASCLPHVDGAPPGQAFRDDFARAELGAHYMKRGGSWRVLDGALNTTGDHNIPLWLDVPLAKNVRVEFTTTSRSPAVDTKVEIFGDGERFESGYIAIIGGWHDTISTLARLDEHERGRKEVRRRWEPNKTYHWTVERKDGHTLTLAIDGEQIVAYDDPAPLFGPRNNKLGFTSWESDVSYDDLVITPLP